MTATEAVTQTPYSPVLDLAIRAIMPDLLSYFVRRLDDPHDAADALAETLLVLWRRRAAMPTEADSWRQYAFGVARNVLKAARRGRVRHRELTQRLGEELAVQLPTTEPQRDGVLAAALSSLKPTDRELFLLVAWDGFGVAEAGALLGLKPAAARQRLLRARSQLRNQVPALL